VFKNNKWPCGVHKNVYLTYNLQNVSSDDYFVNIICAIVPLEGVEEVGNLQKESILLVMF